MHKVDIRLTTEGDEPAANFEVYMEGLKDGKYIETASMREIAGGGSPIVMFLEGDERVIIVAKANQGRLVFDKNQNANVRIETDEEKEHRAQREVHITKSKADEQVRIAQVEVAASTNAGVQAQEAANTKLKKAQADRAALDNGEAQPSKTPAPIVPSRPSIGQQTTLPPQLNPKPVA